MFQNDAYAHAPYLAHFVLGFPALVAILVALLSQKGSTTHIWAGRVFAVGMAVAALTAYYFLTVQFAPPALFDATLMIVCVGTAMLTFQKGTALVRVAEWGLTIISGLAAFILFFVGFQFLSSGLANAAPALIHASVFASLVVGDFRFRARARGEAFRVHRHLYRMAWAVAVGVYAPLFTFRDLFGLSQSATYLGAMALGPIIMVVFWPTANRLTRSG